MMFTRFIVPVLALCSLSILASCDDDDPKPDNNGNGGSEVVTPGGETALTKETAIQKLLKNKTDKVVTGDAFDVTSTSATVVFKLNVPQRELEACKFGLVWTDDPSRPLRSGEGCGELSFNSINEDVENQILVAHLTDIFPSAHYRYAAYYSRGDGFVYGETMSFSTLPPVVFTATPVNLGLSVNWASCNLGAVSPHQAGVFYAYGDTSATLRPADADLLPDANIAGTALDPATYKLGDGWSSPTEDQIMELLNKCKWEKTTLNGYDGFNVTGPNGRYIFIPATGYYVADAAEPKLESYVYLWSGSIVKNKPEMASVIYANTKTSDVSCSQYSRFWRMPIRPVKSK